MYYFGGNDEYGPTPYGKAKGIYMKIGKAESPDGTNWMRKPGVLLDRGAAGDFDALFCGWPQVVDVTGIMKDARLAMYYHTFNVKTFGFEIGVATSRDGELWSKRGPVTMTRGQPGSYRYECHTCVHCHTYN